MMKTINKYFVLLLASLVLWSCDDGFEDLNENPNAATSLEPGPKLTAALLQTAGDRYENWRINLIYCSTMMQHHASTAGYWTGDKYTYNAQYSGSWWERAYGDRVKTLADIIIQLENDTEGAYSADMLAIARIMRVFVFHQLTDLYGDIPYTEASQGFTGGVFQPVYDPQSEIYPDMLNELSEATAALGTGTSQFGSADILFNGDQDKWRKFGNSLMLRLAMRLVKVDPSAAQQWATTAIQGGVMESNDDIAYIVHTDGPEGINRNGIGQAFSVDNVSRLSETFVNELMDDPRLRILGALPNGDFFSSGSNDPALQRGLPNGLDATTVQDIPGGDDLNNFTEANRNFITSEADPYFFQTYAEVEFMLAEAGVRWGIGGDPATHYANGVTAAMQHLELYDLGAEAITDTEISDYLAANPFDAANAIEQIATEYWIATYMNEIETFANWRRTGFPTLTPVDYPGNESNGTIPRRFRYFEREQTTNADNYQAALQRQGPDQFTTRIWWDAQ